MTTKQTKNVTEYNLHNFIQSILKEAKKGWEIDESNPPAFYGMMYETGMVREATDDQLDADAAELAKPSRAEILADARAKKAAKKAAAEQPKAEE